MGRLYTPPSKPLQNGFNGSFNQRQRDELLNVTLRHLLPYARAVQRRGDAITAISFRTRSLEWLTTEACAGALTGHFGRPAALVDGGADRPLPHPANGAGSNKHVYLANIAPCPCVVELRVGRIKTAEINQRLSLLLADS